MGSGSIFPLSLEAGDYILSGCSDGSNNTYMIEIYNGTTYIKNVDGNTSINFSEDTAIRAYITVKNGVTLENVTFYPMLYKGTQEKEYEQHGVMPSPLYPPKIRNCGDNINLINEEEKLHFKTYGGNVTSTVLQANTADTGYLFPCEANKTYTISRGDTESERFRAFCFDENPTQNLSAKATNGAYADAIAGNVGKKITFTTTQNSKYIYVAVGANNIVSNNIKAEKGNKATGWSNHNCGCVDIKVQNKNKIKNIIETKIINGVTYTKNNGRMYATGIATNNSVLVVQDYSDSELIKAGNYVLSIKNPLPSASSFIRLEFSEDKSTIKFKTINIYGNTETYNKFNLPKDGYLKCSILIANGISVNNLELTAQLEEGNKQTDIVEHEEQTITFPLAAGQVLHKDDYLAEDGIHHKRKTIQVNSTNFSTYAPYDGICFIQPKASIDFEYKSKEGFCTHFKNAYIDNCSANGSANTNIPEMCFNVRTGDTKDRVYFKNSSFITSTDWANFFNSNEILLEYECEEYIEAYTEEQQEAYSKIKELYSYENVTHITCEDEIKTTQEVTYRKDFTLAQNNLQSQIDEIKASLASEVSQ